MTPHSRYAIGLMSGTSADGIDAALVEIAGGPKTLQVRQKAFVTYSFPPEIHRELVQMNAEKKVSLEELSRLNFYLGELFAEAAIKVCRKGKIKLSRVSVIGSHGQTISHSPQLKKMGKIPIRSTLQIAEPSVIAERTGVTTVADFRPRDIAAGGEGAPLTPYFHYLLFRQEKRSVAVNNLGGISNLTYIPARGAVKDVIAFDTGPANMVIDETHAALYQGERCDRGGKKAREGLIDLPLVARMLSHAYFQWPPPKSTGRELFGKKFVKDFIKQARHHRLKPKDILATATAFTASSIAESYRQFILKKGKKLDEIIFCGGGVKNKTLLWMIGRELEGVKISTFEDYKMDSGAVEAICFAVLADATLHGWPTNLPTATGARHPVVLGKIVPGNK